MRLLDGHPLDVVPLVREVAGDPVDIAKIIPQLNQRAELGPLAGPASAAVPALTCGLWLVFEATLPPLAAHDRATGVASATRGAAVEAAQRRLDGPVRIADDHPFVRIVNRQAEGQLLRAV